MIKPRNKKVKYRPFTRLFFINKELEKIKDGGHVVFPEIFDLEKTEPVEKGLVRVSISKIAKDTGDSYVTRVIDGKLNVWKNLHLKSQD